MITRNKIISLVLLLYSFGSSRDLKILHMEGTFDIDEDGQYEFAAVEFAPSGQSCVLGNFNKFFVYGYNNRTSSWEESSVKNIENLFTFSENTDQMYHK